MNPVWRTNGTGLPFSLESTFKADVLCSPQLRDDAEAMKTWIALWLGTHNFIRTLRDRWLFTKEKEKKKKTKAVRLYFSWINAEKLQGWDYSYFFYPHDADLNRSTACFFQKPISVQACCSRCCEYLGTFHSGSLLFSRCSRQVRGFSSTTKLGLDQPCPKTSNPRWLHSWHFRRAGKNSISSWTLFRTAQPFFFTNFYVVLCHLL